LARPSLEALDARIFSWSLLRTFLRTWIFTAALKVALQIKRRIKHLGWRGTPVRFGPACAYVEGAELREGKGG
jgi:hypothetical protein